MLVFIVRRLLLAVPVLLGVSVLCIVVTVIILLAHPSGAFIGPWG